MSFIHPAKTEIMDELTAYIIKNYMGLMTFFERAAHRNINVEGKIENASPEEYKISLRETFTFKDYRVKELLKNGAEPFVQSVCESILREHSEVVIINRCPKCKALARTPFAKQCPKCFFDWHEDDLPGKQMPEPNEGIQR